MQIFPVPRSYGISFDFFYLNKPPSFLALDFFYLANFVRVIFPLDFFYFANSVYQFPHSISSSNLATFHDYRGYHSKTRVTHREPGFIANQGTIAKINK